MVCLPVRIAARSAAVHFLTVAAARDRGWQPVAVGVREPALAVQEFLQEVDA
jgi:hypothetical protein